MPDRKRLPDRRAHELISFGHLGMRYVAGIGRFENGALAEVFLNVEKIGTAIDAQARDAAILASLALQHGVPAAEIRHALTRNTDGTASGALGALLDMLAEQTP